MQYIVFFRQIPDRSEKHPNIRNERHQCTQTNGVINYAAATIKNYQGDRDDPQNFNQRHKYSQHMDLAHPGPVVFMIQFLKFAVIADFLAKQLNDANPANGLGKTGVDFGDFNSQITEDIPGASGEAQRRINHNGQHRKGDQRQFPINGQHHCRDAHQQKQILEYH